ncbi:MAG: hypothetical protein WC479_11475 [Candidatus Izemoplasmatales bacterium]
MSKRGDEFCEFSELVLEHIENYTVPQYGDAPNDQVEDWTAAECVNRAIRRYVERYSVNRRGRIEQLRDLLKIAHYAAIAFAKLQPSEDEIKILTKGE